MIKKRKKKQEKARKKNTYLYLFLKEYIYTYPIISRALISKY
jgi:hypothetical protein